MTQTIRHCITVAKGLAILLGAYVTVTLLGMLLARADTLTPPPDADFSLLARHGFWGGALLVFGVASRLLQRNSTEHWLKQGRWLAVVTGAVAVIAAGLNWRLNGGDPDAITNALMVAVPLVLSPTVGAGRPG